MSVVHVRSFEILQTLLAERIKSLMQGISHSTTQTVCGAGEIDVLQLGLGLFA